MGTNFNYDDTSHQVIFDSINGGAGSQPLQEVSQAWQRLGEEIGSTGKSYVCSAIGVILTSRDGAAAHAALTTTSAMLPWMDDVTTAANAAALRVQDQAQYWVTARNSVPPVPPAPKPASFFTDPGEWFVEKLDWFPGVTSDEEKAQQLQQEAAEQARQAMRVYQSSSNTNIDAAPAFTAPQALDTSIGALPLTGTEVGTGSAGTPVAGRGGPAHLMAGQHLPPTAVPYSPGEHPVATAPQLAEGGISAPAGGAVPAEGRWIGSPAPATAPAAALGAIPLLTGLGDSRAGRASGRTGLGRGAAEHAPSYGPRPAAEFGPRPAGGVTPAPESIGGARGSMATAMGRPGYGGYAEPYLAPAASRGEQDREHRSKYLICEDPGALVGDLPPTAPPVIGERC
jgi:hypothetical protein